jgi:hypothetical protein
MIEAVTQLEKGLELLGGLPDGVERPFNRAAHSHRTGQCGHCEIKSMGMRNEPIEHRDDEVGRVPLREHVGYSIYSNRICRTVIQLVLRTWPVAA